MSTGTASRPSGSGTPYLCKLVVSATGDSVTQLLFDLNETEGITLVIVTHSSELAERCSRQLRIVDGRLTERPVGVSR